MRIIDHPRISLVYFLFWLIINLVSLLEEEQKKKRKKNKEEYLPNILEMDY